MSNRFMKTLPVVILTAFVFLLQGDLFAGRKNRPFHPGKHRFEKSPNKAFPTLDMPKMKCDHEIGFDDADEYADDRCHHDRKEDRDEKGMRGHRKHGKKGRLKKDKLDSTLYLLLKDPRALDLLRETDLYCFSGDGASSTVAILVKTTGSTSGIEPFMARVSAKAGDVLGGDIRIRDLVHLANRTDVIYVQPAIKNVPFLNFSRTDMGATGATDSFCARGENVIVGVVDSGIDWNHRDFQTSLGHTKILRLWDQVLGTDYTRAQIDLALGGGPPIPSVDPIGHGTHVASIAAGTGLAYSGSPEARVGIAPASDLMVVRTTMYDDDVVSGIQTLFNEADAMGRPVAVNLSLGHHVGAHDGTDLSAQFLNNLLAGTRGKAIVNAAGNDGDMPIHARVQVPSNGWEEIGVVSYPADPGDSFVVDAWFGDGGQFSTVDIYTPVGWLSGVSNDYVTPWLDGGTNFMMRVTTESSNALNGDAHIRLQVVYTGAESYAWQWAIRPGTQVPLSTGGRLDVWTNWSDDPDYPTPGIAYFNYDGQADYLHTLGVQSCARNVLTVGSYITKTSTPLGSLSTFSSRGPVRPDSTNASDPVKPDIAAPGEYISAALAGSVTHEEHVDKDGTSMAAPHVTGAVALLLQSNPLLDFNEIKSLLRVNARREHDMGIMPNTSWGSGKLDALGSVKKAIPTCYNLVASWGAGDLRSPQGITVGPDRKIYIADSGSNSIKRFRLDGAYDGKEWTAAAGVPFQFPSDTAFGPDGFMYVADQMNHRVVRFDPVDPSSAIVVDMGNNGVCAASNVLCSPAGIAVDDNLDLYIAGYVGISKWVWNGSAYLASPQWQWQEFQTRGTDVVIDRKSATRDLLIQHPFYPSPKILRVRSDTGGVAIEYPGTYGDLIAMDSTCHLYSLVFSNSIRKLDTDCNLVADINVPGYPSYSVTEGMDVDPVSGRVFSIGRGGDEPRILVFEPCP